MSVTKSDFIEIATRHGSNEQEALKDYDLMVSLNFDLSRMTRADLETVLPSASRTKNP